MNRKYVKYLLQKNHLLLNTNVLVLCYVSFKLAITKAIHELKLYLLTCTFIGLSKINLSYLCSNGSIEFKLPYCLIYISTIYKLTSFFNIPLQPISAAFASTVVLNT